VELLNSIMLSGAGIGFLLSVVARFIPNEKLSKIGEGLGKKLSAFGRSKLGWPWEKIENFIQNSFSVFWEGFQKGLDSDDKKRLDRV